MFEVLAGLWDFASLQRSPQRLRDIAARAMNLGCRGPDAVLLCSSPVCRIHGHGPTVPLVPPRCYLGIADTIRILHWQGEPWSCQDQKLLHMEWTQQKWPGLKRIMKRSLVKNPPACFMWCHFSPKWNMCVVLTNLDHVFQSVVHIQLTNLLPTN